LECGTRSVAEVYRFTLNGPAVIELDRQRLAVLICYEQILAYPVLASMLQRPTVLVGISNMYWFSGTTIPHYQGSAIRAWAKLFGVPCLTATNI
jgi:apolipoprotein N-acyltransferase